MKHLFRLTLIAALSAGPMAACTQQEADSAADRAENTAEAAGSEVRSAADATGDAARDVATDTSDAVDNTIDTERNETTVRAGEDGVEVQNTETRQP